MARKKGFQKHSVTIDTLINVVDDGYHNAFGDICCWRERYYLAFRKAQAHDVYPPGDIVVMSCPQGEIGNWQHVKTIDTGGDDRDPHFIIYDGMLQLYWGTYYKRWAGKNTLTSNYFDLISYGSMSKNGKAWAQPWQIYRPGYWLWGTAVEPVMGKDAGGTYGMAYHFGPDTCNSLQLIYKAPGKNSTWVTISTTLSPTYKYTDLSEPTLFFREPDSLVCLTRTEDCLLKGISTYPYYEWSWQEMPIVMHSPNVSFCKGKWIAAGRVRLDCLPRESVAEEDLMIWERLTELRESNLKARATSRRRHIIEDFDDFTRKDIWRTALYGFHPDSSEMHHLLTLPSGWDNGYPGIFYDKTIDRLVLQYYTQHLYTDNRRGIPTPADIYVATIKAEF